MSFDVAPEAYDRFMGRYSSLLSPQLADLAGVHAGQRVLDVGCGPGALTAELVMRLGPAGVSAVDPSEPFVAAAQARHPGVDVHRASAEQLPFPDGAFDAALAQLVVHFMSDPVAGVTEMARVTRRDGVLAACVWDHGADGQGPLSVFWQAARAIDPEVDDESELAGTREGQLAVVFEAAGLHEIQEAVLLVSVEHRASKSGGSRIPTASAPPAHTWPASTPNGRPSCANAAMPCSPSHPLCSSLARGQPAVSRSALGVEVVSARKLVPHTGFEPVISALRGRCPRPLDECGNGATGVPNRRRV